MCYVLLKTKMLAAEDGLTDLSLRLIKVKAAVEAKNIELPLY